ncbi:hypothetical protein E1B28_013240 [Marasmius oreades]|uniref:Glucose-methanol-choline oxidoreductase N-terminal domain-containing protein n=1 Tax=Marasmius oreades TaxID=181124 RepID=A0A9P7UMT5_9AGAR|nr:uncharacterized protein E1B28_013240 [Marasmius oreades]KAG7087260.1 hypothetical protein E1B28_013240 [Marasmius oreades]
MLFWTFFKFMVDICRNSTILSLEEVPLLVVEAGVKHTNDIKLQVPLWYPRSFNIVKDWNYTSVPQPGLHNRSVGFPRGHVLGGSNCLSGMASTRGPAENYDRIAKVTEDDRWAWRNMLPFVYKNEKLVPPTDHHNTTNPVISSVHGQSGIMGYSVPSYPSPLAVLVIQTTQEPKDEFSYTRDMNAGDEYELGFGHPLQCWVGPVKTRLLHISTLSSSSNTILMSCLGRESSSKV